MQGAQRELMKYWSRVSGNRWLVAKMFGVLMVGFGASKSPLRVQLLIIIIDILLIMGSHCGLNEPRKLQPHKRWRLGMHYLTASIRRNRLV